MLWVLFYTNFNNFDIPSESEGLVENREPKKIEKETDKKIIRVTKYISNSSF